MDLAVAYQMKTVFLNYLQARNGVMADPPPKMKVRLEDYNWLSRMQW